MMKQGSSSDDIHAYLKDVTARMQQQFDKNFTGLYGYINGEYLDGAGWVPPEDYDPTQRSWYKEALAAGGEMVVSDPYVDAQTGEIVISFTQMLSDGKSVISLDVILNEVQKITEDMTMGDKGYGFIVDSSGLVVAHYDKSEIGGNYSEDSEYGELFSLINGSDAEERELTIGDDTCTVFSGRIVNNWYVVIVANNELLFANLRSHIMIGVLIACSIYLVIVIFCIVSIRKIRKAEKNEQESIEQLRQMNMNIIRSLSYAIDAKDRYTRGHSQRVAEYSLMLAKRMGKSAEEQ